MEEIKIAINPKVPNIPQYKDKTKIDVRYMVLAPFGLLYPSLNIFNFVVGYISMIELISIVENIKKVGVKVPNVKKFIPRVKKGD